MEEVLQVEEVRKELTLDASSPRIGVPLLLTIPETAEQLRLGRTRTHQLVIAGRIPSVTIGRRRMVIRSGLERFVDDLWREQNDGQR